MTLERSSELPPRRKRDRPPRNQRPDLNGLLVIDKPLGMSSAHVCTVVRAKSRGGKVGHAGSLDPLATGVLVVCLGRATKLVERIMTMPKRYEAEVDLSAFSTTDDAEGEKTPVEVGGADRPTLARIGRVIAEGFTGEIRQVPPAFSALKIGGRPAYRLARRAGGAPEMEARVVRIDSIGVTGYDWPLLTLDVACGRGTYVRSLARDIGSALGVGGHLTALRRTAVGPFTIERAVGLASVPDGMGPEDLLPMDELGAAGQE